MATLWCAHKNKIDSIIINAQEDILHINEIFLFFKIKENKIIMHETKRIKYAIKAIIEN